jgi:hypothetical protein
MELVHGLTLAEWLKSRGPMPLARFVPFLEAVANAANAANAAMDECVPPSTSRRSFDRAHALIDSTAKKAAATVGRATCCW